MFYDSGSARCIWLKMLKTKLELIKKVPGYPAA